MPWYGTVDDTRKLVQRVRIVKELMTLVNGSTGAVIGALQRNNIVTSETWVGIQENAATAFVQAQGTLGTVEDISAERANDAGAFTVRQDVIQYGTWY